jgi:hypothetical protein
MKIAKGYKLFEQDQDGNLYALFIDKKTIMPIGEWLKAGNYPTKGFAARPGYHIGAEMPSAPWLMSADGTYKSQRGKRFRRVWCEVEYVADVDYTEEVLRQPKKCFTDRLPDGGFYNFRESGNRLWIIADRIKVTKVISEAERMEILSKMNYDEREAFEPYRQAMAKRMKTA